MKFTKEWIQTPGHTAAEQVSCKSIPQKVIHSSNMNVTYNILKHYMYINVYAYPNGEFLNKWKKNYKCMYKFEQWLVMVTILEKLVTCNTFTHGKKLIFFKD